jgi:glutathione S-transferase
MAATPDARLFCLQGSAPSYSGELMLRHKGVSYRRVDLVVGRHRSMLKARGFPGGTVPAVELGERRIQTNRGIARALDELYPHAPLLPADAAARARTEEAERFGDEELQPLTRRIVLGSIAQDPGSVRAHRAIGRLPIPRGPSWWRRLLMRPTLDYYGITGERLRQDKLDLPPLLDRLDGHLAEGALNAAQLSAADLQVGPLVAALEGVRELEAEVGRRPAAALARRVLS